MKTRNLLMNKKGAEMTIGTIIVIILALVVLVLLILGFSTGWTNLWDKIINLGGGGQANVDTIVQACNIACTTNSQYEYCRAREVNFGKDAGGKVTLSCNQLEKRSSVGLADCAGVSCPVCEEQAGDTEGTLAVKCSEQATEICPAGKSISGTNVAEGETCCKIACTAKTAS